MANGDEAAAAGMDVVDGFTADMREGYDEINKTRDYIAQRTSPHDSGTPTYVGTIAAGGVMPTMPIAFKPGEFTVAPAVTVTSSSTRVNPAAGNITTAGFDLNAANWTSGGATNPGFSWIAASS